MTRGPLAEAAVRALAWRGRHLVVGFASDTIPRIPLNLPLVKGASVVGVFFGEFTRREPSAHGPERARGGWSRTLGGGPPGPRPLGNDLQFGADGQTGVAVAMACG
jgi:hypothetical protein